MATFIETPCRTFTSGATLSQYVRVKLSSGALVAAGVGDDDRWIGTVERDCISGDRVPVRLRTAQGTRKMIASESFSVGATLYGAASGKVGSTSTGAPMGLALEASGADGNIIEVLPLAGGAAADRTLKSAVAASTAITASSTETDFSNGSAVIPGADLQVGDVIRCRLQGTATATNSTDTLTVKLYLGTEEIATTGAVDAANGDIFYMDVDIVVRAIGASGAIVAAGVVANGVVGTVTAKPFLKAQATEDISGDTVLKATGKWSTTDPGNSCRLDVFNAQLLRAAA